jgi:inhibitor of KinA
MRSESGQLELPKFVPLGDQAILAYFPDEPTSFRFAQSLRHSHLPWILDIVPAYNNVGIFFDPAQIRMRNALDFLDSHVPENDSTTVVGIRHDIPCCYELQLDWKRVTEFTGQPVDYLIKCHCAVEYTIYAIGFTPGFPYMGYVPDVLSGVPRLPAPRLQVEPGSVGLTGRQTGIYPLPRPGGWNLIAKTPLILVDVDDGYFPLRVGDRVQFFRIDEAEFRRLQGERLASGRTGPSE